MFITDINTLIPAITNATPCHATLTPVRLQVQLRVRYSGIVKRASKTHTRKQKHPELHQWVVGGQPGSSYFEVQCCFELQCAG